MIKVENIQVSGFEAAIRGCRNPMNSWDRSDSYYTDAEFSGRYGDAVMMERNFYIGEKDMDLMQRLFKSGTEQRKYLRMIHVSMDITAPIYWLSEADTYKVGVTRDSCSFMHKGLAKPFDYSEFSTHMETIEDTEEEEQNLDALYQRTFEVLNKMREKYQETHDPELFERIRCLLPSGYNIKATFDMNYENVFNMIRQRKNHRLSEWREFVSVLENLPYVKQIGGLTEGEV